MISTDVSIIISLKTYVIFFSSFVFSKRCPCFGTDSRERSPIACSFFDSHSLSLLFFAEKERECENRSQIYSIIYFALNFNIWYCLIFGSRTSLANSLLKIAAKGFIISDFVTFISANEIWGTFLSCFQHVSPCRFMNCGVFTILLLNGNGYSTEISSISQLSILQTTVTLRALLT